MTPYNIHHNSIEIPVLKTARDFLGEGVPTLTPYVLIDGIKQFQVKVTGYESDHDFLNLDTQCLFVGNTNGKNEEVPYSKENEGAKGTRGGPSVSLPVQFRRIHFLGYENGIQNMLDSENNHTQKINQYFTYVLCSSPVKLKTVENFEKNQGPEFTDDLSEEKYGTPTTWGTSYDDTVTPQLTIGGVYAPTGKVIKRISFENASAGCDAGQKMIVQYANAYLAGPLYEAEAEEEFFVNFTSGQIKQAVERVCANVENLIGQLQECCSNSGTGTGVPGSGPSGSQSSGSACCPIDAEGMFDCTELFCL